jgi:hypothetical protein
VCWPVSSRCRIVAGHGVELASSDFGLHGNMNRDDWAGNVEDRL